MYDLVNGAISSNVELPLGYISRFQQQTVAQHFCDSWACWILTLHIICSYQCRIWWECHCPSSWNQVSEIWKVCLPRPILEPPLFVEI